MRREPLRQLLAVPDWVAGDAGVVDAGGIVGVREVDGVRLEVVRRERLIRDGDSGDSPRAIRTGGIEVAIVEEHHGFAIEEPLRVEVLEPAVRARERRLEVPEVAAARDCSGVGGPLCEQAVRDVPLRERGVLERHGPFGGRDAGVREDVERVLVVPASADRRAVRLERGRVHHPDLRLLEDRIRQ